MTDETTHDGRGRVKVEPCAKRVRAYLGGQPVVDSHSVLMVWEAPYYPTYYFPSADVTAELVTTGLASHSPSRGEAEILDVRTKGAEAVGAALRYPDSPIPELRDVVRFEWGLLDEWLEEDEPVYVHPRNPYHRVDILASTRHVVVEVEGVRIAESSQPRMLFETGLPARYYLPLTAYDPDVLRPSDSESQCPYKGTATYFDVEIGDRRHEDLLWIYRYPLPESQKIAGLAAPYNERVDLVVDGTRLDRPHTPFS